MSGQIPSSLQWEQPFRRPADDAPVDALEESVAQWCADNGHVHNVIVHRSGAGVAVVLAEVFDLDLHRVFRGGTRTEALQLAMSWCLQQGTAGGDAA